MLNKIKSLFSSGPKTDYAELIKNGAIIVDVRTPGEFANGHVKGSLNIPLDQLRNNLKKLKGKEQVIITCCASGMRSASAKGILEQAGYINIYNGGSWHNLEQYGK